MTDRAPTTTPRPARRITPLSVITAVMIVGAIAILAKLIIETARQMGASQDDALIIGVASSVGTVAIGVVLSFFLSETRPGVFRRDGEGGGEGDEGLRFSETVFGKAIRTTRVKAFVVEKAAAERSGTFVPVDSPEISAHPLERLRVRIDNGRYRQRALSLIVRAGLADDAWRAIRRALDELPPGGTLTSRQLRDIGAEGARDGRRESRSELSEGFGRATTGEQLARFARHVALASTLTSTTVILAVIVVVALWLEDALDLDSTPIMLVALPLGAVLLPTYFAAARFIDVLLRLRYPTVRADEDGAVFEWSFLGLTHETYTRRPVDWELLPFMKHSAPMVELRVRCPQGPGHLAYAEATGLTRESCVLALDRMVEEAHTSGQTIKVNDWLKKELESMRAAAADDEANNGNAEGAG